MYMQLLLQLMITPLHPTVAKLLKAKRIRKVQEVDQQGAMEVIQQRANHLEKATEAIQ